MDLHSFYLIGCALATVFVTCCDDLVWLVPFVTSDRWLVEVALGRAFGGGHHILGLAPEDILRVIAALLAWLIAAWLFAKKLQRLMQRRSFEEVKIGGGGEGMNYGSINAEATDVGPTFNSNGLFDHENEVEPQPALQKDLPHDLASETATRDRDWGALARAASYREGEAPSMPMTVVALTALGALDEVSYFPSLLISHTYSVYELSLGAGLACLVILGLVLFAWKSALPLIKCVDQVPLWAVVSIYATLMTLNAWWHISVVQDGDGAHSTHGTSSPPLSAGAPQPV